MYQFAYGDKFLDVDIPEKHPTSIIMPRHFDDSQGGQDLVKKALASPIASPLLESIIKQKQARNAVIIVNDITRPTPYDLILPPLLAEIEGAGILSSNITLIVATGIHRPHLDDDNLAIFGADICQKYRIENHDCDENLLSLGTLSNGMELIINRTAAEADLLITTGVVSLHYFAGYSGGRKSILPGISGRQAIEANHKMMNDPRARLGNYEDNPVSDLMIEAARQAGVDYILNVVMQSHHDIAYCVAGDMEQAWLEAVKYCEQMNVIEITEAADIVIASCGGYPKDINMYQAQKALDAAILAVKPGGTIILLAECREGLGEDTFEDWIDQATCPQDIVDRFHKKFELGGHKAFAICRIIETVEVCLLSDLDDKRVEELFLTPIHSLNEGIQRALDKYSINASIIIMPEASKIAVKIKKSE